MLENNVNNENKVKTGNPGIKPAGGSFSSPGPSPKVGSGAGAGNPNHGIGASIGGAGGKFSSGNPNNNTSNTGVKVKVGDKEFNLRTYPNIPMKGLKNPEPAKKLGGGPRSRTGTGFSLKNGVYNYDENEERQLNSVARGFAKQAGVEPEVNNSLNFKQLYDNPNITFKNTRQFAKTEVPLNGETKPEYLVNTSGFKFDENSTLDDFKNYAKSNWKKMMSDYYDPEDDFDIYDNDKLIGKLDEFFKKYPNTSFGRFNKNGGNK